MGRTWNNEDISDDQARGGRRRGSALKALGVLALGTVMGMTAATGTASAQLDGLGSAGQVVTASSEPEPEMRAPEGGARLVTFGDSLMTGVNLPHADGGHGCIHSNSRYVARIAKSLNIYNTGDFQDRSCLGSTIDTKPYIRFADQAKFHENNGAFGPRTEHVLIQLGANDEWGTPGVTFMDTARMCMINVVEGCDMDAVAQGRAQDPNAITAEAYAARMQQVMDYIKHFAPNAKISLLSYPTMLGTGDRTCTSVLGLPVEQPRDQLVVALYDRLFEAQRGAAGILGVNFIDLKTPSAMHGPCTPDPWIAGVLDPASQFNGTPGHLNNRGEAAVAEIVKGQM